MYQEVLQLYEYCKRIGVEASLSKLWDGYKITFAKGNGDVVQHSGSYGSKCGCVEPAIGSRVDYTAVSLVRMKDIIRKRHNKGRI